MEFINAKIHDLGENVNFIDVFRPRPLDMERCFQGESTVNMVTEHCPVCKKELSQGYCQWHFLCRNCGYEKANLEQSINLQSAHELVDESARESGLREVRRDNFQTLLNRIRSLKPTGGRLLEIGSAHGWFLEEAEKYGFDVLGIEPDKNVFATAVQKKIPMRSGYFPNALKEGEMFDVIVFNDVIEHIPNIEFILSYCKDRLQPDGLLVLNLPSSTGIFYRLSKLFCGVGFTRFFDRLWQKDLPSPHLHYFNSANLSELLRKKGFEIKETGKLSTLSLDTLYKRISYTGEHSFPVRVLIFLAIMASLPMLNFLPSDIIYNFSMKRSST